MIANHYNFTKSLGELRLSGASVQKMKDFTDKYLASIKTT